MARCVRGGRRRGEERIDNGVVTWHAYHMQPDPQLGRYYVTVIDGTKPYFLAGPWETHAEALAQVESVRRFAEHTDPRAFWMAYGTARQSLDGEAIKSALGSNPTAWQLRTG